MSLTHIVRMRQVRGFVLGGKNMLIAKKPAKQGLSIIIVGCGKVGLTLIEQLVKEGHDITIIDQNENKVQRAIENAADIADSEERGHST